MLSSKFIPLGDLAENITVGYVGSMASEYVAEGIPFLRSLNIKPYRYESGDLKYVSKEFHQKIKKSRLQPGDVAVVRTGNPGTACVIPESLPEANCSDLVVIRCGEKLDPHFVSYYVNSVTHSHVKNQLVGAIQKHFNIQSAKELPFPDITKNQQKAISGVLRILDAKIQLNNRINAELEAMAKTLYDYWFVQFDFPDQNGQPYKTSGGRMVYNETLKREIPAGWEASALADWIANDKTGDWGKASEEGNYTLQVNCIRGADINGVNGAGNIAAPNRFILNKNKHKLLSPFDLVVEISGGSPTQSTGRMAFLLEETLTRFSHPVICSNFCKAISLQNSDYFFNFVYQWSQLYDNGVLFGWEGKTSGIKNLLFDAFVNKYEVCKPPEELAKGFYDFVMPLQIKKQKLLKENQQLTQLRDWLLPMLMNGQVKVK